MPASILIHNHVIKDADEIKVKLSDKREFKGKVIGTDRKHTSIGCQKK